MEPEPAGKGELAIGVSTPELDASMKPEILFETSLATYRNFPDGSTTTDAGPLATPNGDPGVVARAPVAELTSYADTLLDALFVTYKKRPEGSMAIEDGSTPAAIDVPTWEMAPLTLSTAKVTTELVEGSVA